MDEGSTHYVGDACPGGHADVAELLGVCPGCGRAEPCRHCTDDRPSR